MAEIYLAKAKGIGGFEKLLALKMIHPRFSEDDHFINMLIEEAKISVQLNHVNIGQIFDLGRIEETYYIAMEYIEGADVYRTMRRASEMGVEVPVDTAVYVAQEICAGLDYAHRKRDAAGKPLKIIHRDISPQNVLISFAGEVKIVDFGIAKASLRAKETEVGVIKGKYYYMSPEQAWGDPVDHRTDIFSTGIILYEMLTGQMLYMEDNVPALLDRVRKADIAPASSRRPEIPKPLDEIVMKTLAKYPDDRYQTAHELQTALTRFLFSFSPDYTASMLSGLVGWLFADEIKRPSSPPAPKLPVPPRDSSEDSLEIMTGDELAEEVVVKSVIFDMEDLTSVRAAKAMAAMRQGSRPPPDDEKTSMQTAVPPGARGSSDDDDLDDEGDADEGDEATGVWGDETLIDRDHKFKEIAEHYRNIEAEKRRVAAAAPAPVADGEAATEAVMPPSESRLRDVPPPKRAADQETRPVELADVPRRRPATAAPVIVTPEVSADQERTLRAQSRASGAIPPLVVPPAAVRPAAPAPPPPASRPAPPAPARPPSHGAVPAVAPPPARGPAPGAASVPAARASTAAASPPPPAAPPLPRPPPPPRGGGKSTMMGPAVAPSQPPPPPPLVEPPPMVTPPTPQVAIGRDSIRHQDLEPMEQAPTMAAVAVLSPPIQIAADEQLGGTLSDSAMTHVATPAMGRRGTASAAAVAAPPPAPAPRPVAPVAPPPIASAQTKPIQAPPASAKPAHIVPQPEPRSITGTLPTESPSAPLIVHDPFTASYLAAPPRPSGARTLLWVVAAAVLAVGVVVATVVFLSPPAAEPCVLEITSHPPGARVTVGDTPVSGTTPLRVEGLQAGQSYQLEVALDGFQPWRQQFQASPGVIQQIAILDAVRGTLQIQSNPPGAQIYIDNVYRGSTPLTIPGLEITRPLQVRAERAGFVPDERHLAWNGQTQSNVTFDLRPLPR